MPLRCSSFRQRRPAGGGQPATATQPSGGLQGRIALWPSTGLLGDMGGQGLALAGTRHHPCRTAAHRSRSGSAAPGGHTYPVGRASLRDYTIFTANRYSKTGPETVQEQLAANESSQIIYRTLVSHSSCNCCFSLSYSSQDPQNPLYQQNELVVADATSALCRAAGSSEEAMGKAPGKAQGQGTHLGAVEGPRRAEAGGGGCRPRAAGLGSREVPAAGLG